MRHCLIAIAAVSLAACGEKQAENVPERQNAAGEVLGGEISDEMLPLETVRSTSPAGPGGANSVDADGERAAPRREPPSLSGPSVEISGGPGDRQPIEPQRVDEPPAE